MPVVVARCPDCRALVLVENFNDHLDAGCGRYIALVEAQLAEKEKPEQIDWRRVGW